MKIKGLISYCLSCVFIQKLRLPPYVSSKVKVRDARDLSLAYSPGVAEPCLAIHENEGKVYDLQHGEVIGKVSKEWFTLGDSYKVQILKEEMEASLSQ